MRERSQAGTRHRPGEESRDDRGHDHRHYQDEKDGARPVVDRPDQPGSCSLTTFSPAVNVIRSRSWELPW